MNLKIFLIIVLFPSFLSLAVPSKDLKALERERELRGLIKVKLHGEPLPLLDEHDETYNASKSLAFSPDGKHLAVGFTPGPVVIYDIAAEKAKRFDAELEKLKQESKQSV